MRVRVTHNVGTVARNLKATATTTKPKVARAVKRNTVQGRKRAQKFARESSGPHGLHYFKRITDEMVTPLMGEYGPNAGLPVGAGYRHGPPNTDLPRSADIQTPVFVKDVGDALDGASM